MMIKYLMRLATVLCCAMTMAVFTACTDAIDNPVNPGSENPETPAQQAFWAPFDAWQTDSCTVGDDFFMHMIGTWWKNPVDIYPKGLLGYATDLNDQRVEAIKQSNPNVSLLRAHVDAKLTMNKEEVEQMVNAKVDELWAGATTREEALAALGRAWAEGYTLWLEPVVTLLDGVPTWQLNVKIPSYVNETHFAKHKEFIWQLMAPRKSVRMNARRTHNVLDDLSIIVNAMNIGINYIEIADEAADMLQDKMTT